MKRAISKVDVNGKNSSVVKSGLQGIMDVCVFDIDRQNGNVLDSYSIYIKLCSHDPILLAPTHF